MRISAPFGKDEVASSNLAISLKARNFVPGLFCHNRQMRSDSVLLEFDAIIGAKQHLTHMEEFTMGLVVQERTVSGYAKYVTQNSKDE